VIAKEIERGEDYLKEEFERALAMDSISDATRAVIAQAYDSVKKGHDRASALKHGFTEAA